MNTIPYFVIYSGEYKVFRNKLNEEEMLKVIDKISDISVLGVSDIEFTNPFQQLFFDKLLAQYEKNLRSYIAKVENGKKGGRPKKEETPIDNVSKPKANSPPVFVPDKPKELSAKEKEENEKQTREVMEKARQLMREIQKRK